MLKKLIFLFVSLVLYQSANAQDFQNQIERCSGQGDWQIVISQDPSSKQMLFRLYLIVERNPRPDIIYYETVYSKSEPVLSRLVLKPTTRVQYSSPSMLLSVEKMTGKAFFMYKKPGGKPIQYEYYCTPVNL